MAAKFVPHILSISIALLDENGAWLIVNFLRLNYERSSRFLGVMNNYWKHVTRSMRNTKHQYECFLALLSALQTNHQQNVAF